MALIDVDKIEVVKAQEGGWFQNGDELYLTVNGKLATETTPSLETGESYNFTPQWIHFSGKATVNLYEKDGWLNPDDYVATATLYASQAPANDILKMMDGAGGMYDVYFDLV